MKEWYNKIEKVMVVFQALDMDASFMVSPIKQKQNINGGKEICFHLL